MEGVYDFFAGYLGGIAGLLIGHPADTIKVRQQSMNETFIQTVTKTYKYEGLFGFYKGMMAPLFIVGPSNAIFFSTYGFCLRHFQGPSTGRTNLDDPHWMRNIIMAGSLAGFAQMLFTCPVEVVKIILQVHTSQTGKDWKPHYEVPYNSPLKVARGIYSVKGWRGFYRGGVPMFWRDVPTSAIYMYVFESLLPQGEYRPAWQRFLAGGFAGVASWMFTVPFDVIKSRLQSDDLQNPYYKGMRDCFSKSLKADGVQIFFKGFWIVTCRSFPVNAITLLVYETIGTALKNY